MNIEVKIRRIFNNERRMKAIASVAFDGVLAVHDVKVISGPTRLFVSMPSRKCENGTFMDIVHPIGTEMRQQIETAVIEEYERCRGAVSE